jgi:hypothetical protein
MVERAIGEMFGSDRNSAPIDYMRAFVIDEVLQTKAPSKQLLGVQAALRSKNPLTPQTLLEMSGIPTLRTCDTRAGSNRVEVEPLRRISLILPAHHDAD